MGWFHDTFGFSSQGPKEVLSDVGRSIWDNNPLALIGRGLDSMGAHKVGRIITPPTWDELATPGEAFVSEFDQRAGVLPADWRQYAAPVVGAALSVVNPFAGAAFNTAYNAGKMQQNQKGMDWGNVARDAGINFGTAAVGNALKNFGAGGPDTPKAGVQVSNVSAPTASSASGALDAFNGGASSALASTQQAAASGAAGAANALGTAGGGAGSLYASNNGQVNYGSQPANGNALQQFNQGRPSAFDANAVGASEAMQPGANAVQGSGVQNLFQPDKQNAVQKAVAKVGTDITNEQLTSSLTPEMSSPITGAGTGDVAGFSNIAGGLRNSPLAAFGGPELLQEPTEYDQSYIDGQSFKDAMTRLGANKDLQQRDLMDRFREAGQTDLDQNPRYSRGVEQINNSADLAQEQYKRDAALANQYHEIKLFNNLSDEQMQQYIKSPELLPPDMQPLFTSFQPMFNF